MLRPCHLLAFCATSAEVYWSHEALGIGRGHGRGVHLHVGPELRVGVGVGDVGREEHRGRHRFQLEVDAGLLAGLLDDRLLLLARAVDRRLVDELQLLAAFSRTPSAPFFQPAASSRALALSTLNSHLVFVDLKRGGLFMKFAVAMPVRP